MNKKKIIWIVILAIFVMAVVGMVIFFDIQSKKDTTAGNTTALQKNTEATTGSNQSEDPKYQKIELEDGILYALDGKQETADVVVGDNYYDTTITDMYLNSESYANKTIQIEGMYLENSPYVFVGRYSTSNLCPTCPPGYSYMEYQLSSPIDQTLVNEQNWIKVIGTLEKGNDETSNYQDYYYLQVLNLEVMNERGQDTVSN